MCIVIYCPGELLHHSRRRVVVDKTNAEIFGVFVAKTMGSPNRWVHSGLARPRRLPALRAPFYGRNLRGLLALGSLCYCNMFSPILDYLFDRLAIDLNDKRRV